jgi:hypothetical protein
LKELEEHDSGDPFGFTKKSSSSSFDTENAEIAAGKMGKAWKRKVQSKLEIPGDENSDENKARESKKTSKKIKTKSLDDELNDDKENKKSSKKAKKKSNKSKKSETINDSFDQNEK